MIPDVRVPPTSTQENSATFLLTAASGQLPSGVLDFRLPAIELSERNGRPSPRIPAESPRRAVHDIQPRRLQVCPEDTLRDGERKTSWTIVRQTGIRLLRVPRSERFHGVRGRRIKSTGTQFLKQNIKREREIERKKLTMDFSHCLFSWLTKIDVAGTSPLLNFGRAMILGYGNRGNSVACYEAFPKCPRDAYGLVYYLNNYNGGFFNLFNRIRGGKYRTSERIPGQRGETIRGIGNFCDSVVSCRYMFLCPTITRRIE